MFSFYLLCMWQFYKVEKITKRKLKYFKDNNKLNFSHISILCVKKLKLKFFKALSKPCRDDKENEKWRVGKFMMHWLWMIAGGSIERVTFATSSRMHHLDKPNKSESNSLHTSTLILLISHIHTTYIKFVTAWQHWKFNWKVNIYIKSIDNWQYMFTDLPSLWQ